MDFVLKNAVALYQSLPKSKTCTIRRSFAVVDKGRFTIVLEENLDFQQSNHRQTLN